MTGATATLLLSLSVIAQAPVRDGARAASTGTAAIAGVISSDTQPSRPLRRVMVNLTSAHSTALRTTVATDDAGKLQFSGLPAGRYRVTASRPGWISMSYGAKRSGRPGASVAIEEGQVATIAMRLPRTAVISGVVLDSTGQPSRW